LQTISLTIDKVSDDVSVANLCIYQFMRRI
jgi:hypothetical protein